VEDREAQSDGLRRKQQQTDETEALLQTLQAASPVGLGLLDRDLGFLRVNEVLADITGATGTESETNFADLAPPAWQHVVDACRQTLATGEPVHGLTVTGGPDQAGTWLASCHPLPHHGTPTCVGLVLTDVTDYRRDAEFHTVILQNMSEGVYSTDAQGRLTSMNPAAMRMLGWAQCDILGQPAHELLHGRRADGSRCPADQSPILDVCRSGVPMTVSDAVLTCKDGSLLPVAYSVAPLRIGAAVTGVVTVFHDTTGLRRQQQRDVEARHDQKLESLGRLSAGLAHEINTPIQFVGDNTRFLAGAYQDMLGLLLVYRHCMNSGELPWQERKKLSDDAEAKADIEYLAAEVPAAIEQSLEGIDRVATLVRAMKSFSYKDSNNKAYADLNEAIRTTSIVARNEVKYVADLELDLGELPEVLCHVGDLNQVFLNLLVNAADAMEAREDRGRITVRTRAEEGWVVLSFADDGSGIPAENQKTIFEPFFTTKEVGKGTGQGLALARAVVCDKHDGTIELNSTLGEGSEFILRLPISGKANRAAA
jgi:PAS domain S-box-containing protein